MTAPPNVPNIEPDWPTESVSSLQERGILLVEDGNHGEYRPRRDEFVDAGVAFIRAADMDNGRVLFDRASRINAQARERITKGIGAPGDVLLSHKGTVGKVAIAPLDAPAFVCSPQTTFWRTLDPEQLDRQYLYAFLRSPGFREQLAARAGETDMAPYVSLTSQRGLLVTLPPIEIQRCIGRFLGSLDDKIELNRRMNRTLEALARAVFRAWFVDFEPVKAKAAGATSFPGMPQPVFDQLPTTLVDSDLGPIPEGWEVGCLGNIVTILDSQRIPLSKKEREQRRGQYPYYGATGVIDHVDGFLFDGVHVLLGEDGSVVTDDGRPYVQYVWGQYWVNNHAHVLGGARGVSNEQLYLFLQDVHIRPYVTGAVQPKLNQRNMKAVPTILAPEDICGAFAEMIEPCFALLRANADESRTLASIRDALLPKLISG